MRQKLSERITVRLPYRLALRLRGAVGARGQGAFIRRAVEAALETIDLREDRHDG